MVFHVGYFLLMHAVHSMCAKCEQEEMTSCAKLKPGLWTGPRDRRRGNIKK